MTDLENCIICDEKHNKSTHKVIKCQYCNFCCCKKCCQTYILNQPIVRCMNNQCAKEWTRQYIRGVLPLAFINKELKEHKEHVLFDQERALMPATQPIIERRIKIDNLIKVEKDLKEEIQEIHMKMSENARLLNRLRYGRDTGEERTAVFVRACPAEDCRGFLSTQWKCGICQKWTCPHCHIIKGDTRDCDHTCNPDDVSTAELLNKDTKPCPKCGIGIFKIDGCSQMFCTQCHTAFDWRTGLIETNHIHNPHYFEWMRRNGTLERNPNDVICGRELDHRLFNKIHTTISNKISKSDHISKDAKLEILQKAKDIMETGRAIIHMQQVELHRFNYNYELNNQELRIQYMRNRLTEAEFKNKLQIQNKKHHKHLEIRNVLQLVIDSMIDICFRFNTEVLKPEWNMDFTIINEAEALRQYANDCLSEISRTYGCVKFQLNNLFALKSR